MPQWQTYFTIKHLLKCSLWARCVLTYFFATLKAWYWTSNYVWHKTQPVQLEIPDYDFYCPILLLDSFSWGFFFFFFCFFSFLFFFLFFFYFEFFVLLFFFLFYPLTLQKFLLLVLMGVYCSSHVWMKEIST